MLIAEALFWLAVGLIGWVYLGYPALLALAGRLMGRRAALEQTGGWPSISVIIAAHNEERNIVNRIRNALDADYPAGLLEVVVASDGSRDGTAGLARNFGDPRVTVLDFPQQRGRALVHNDGVKTARGEIAVFTDASTEFTTSTLRELARPFSDAKVGCVVGELGFRSSAAGAVEAGQSLYWRYELTVRRLESRLGLLATGTGACMALRRSLWRNLRPAEDVDFVSPLQAVQQGARVVFAPEARAWDEKAASTRAEFRNRARMTSRNLVGTLRHWGPRWWLAYPAVTLGLYSHKILRWLVPYLAAAALALNAAVAAQGAIYGATLAGQAVFYGAALVGWALERRQKQAPVVSSLFWFCVANAAMMLGVAKGLLGRAPAAYRSSPPASAEPPPRA